MQKLLLLAVFLLPATTWAQVSTPAPTGSLKPRVVGVAMPPSIEQALAGLANPRILELATAADLYRQLRDTSSGRAARHLRPGDLVLIRATRPHWLVVCRAQSPTQIGSDTTTYYLPEAAMKGGKTFILL